jgi:hypothetical protein
MQSNGTGDAKVYFNGEPRDFSLAETRISEMRDCRHLLAPAKIPPLPGPNIQSEPPDGKTAEYFA